MDDVTSVAVEAGVNNRFVYWFIYYCFHIL